MSAERKLSDGYNVISLLLFVCLLVCHMFMLKYFLWFFSLDDPTES